MRAIVLPAVAVVLGAGLFAAPQAQARFNGVQMQAPSMVESAACVVRRERIVRPNGRVVHRTVRRCGVGRPHHWRNAYRRHDDCRVIRERVERPNGRVVYRTIRRCR